MSGTDLPRTAPRADIVPLLLAIAAPTAMLGAIAFFAWRMTHGAFTPDFPWLWRAGQHVLETGGLPAGDIFSWSRSGEPWVLHQWLFDVAVAGGERLLGLRSLLMLFTVAAIAIYAVAPLCGAVPRSVAPPFVLLPAALGLAVVSIDVSLRPTIVTAAFLLVQYCLIQQLRRRETGGRATLLLLLPVYLLWGNMDAGVVLGLLSLALFAAGDLAERRDLYRFEPTDPVIEGQPIAWPTYLMLIAAAFLASLANPYGFGIYEQVAALSRQSYLNEVARELQSPDFHKLLFRWFLLFVGALLFFLTRSRRTLAAADLLHLVLLSGCTLYSLPFIVWAVLFYILVLPRAIHHEWIASLAQQDAAPAPVQQAPAALLRTAGAVSGLLLPMLLWLTVAGDPEGSSCGKLRPAITAYLSARQTADRLFNDPVAGSCILAQDAEQPVFIDTRFGFYGTDFVREAMDILRLAPGWERTLESWDIDAVIADRGWPLAQALLAGDAFVVLFEDENAVVLRRRPATGQ